MKKAHKKTVTEILASKVCRPRFHTRPKEIRAMLRAKCALNRGVVRGDCIRHAKLNLEYRWAQKFVLGGGDMSKIKNAILRHLEWLKAARQVKQLRKARRLMRLSDVL